MRTSGQGDGAQAWLFAAGRALLPATGGALLLATAACAGALEAPPRPGGASGVPGGSVEPPTGSSLDGGSAVRNGAADAGRTQAASEPQEPPDLTRPQTAVSCDAYQATPVHAYASKVKRLLTVDGALTDAELSAIGKDPALLAEHIGRWLSEPGAKPKLLRFFETAFQQDGFLPGDLFGQWGQNPNAIGTAAGMGERAVHHLERSFRESFARTALWFLEQGRPFNELASTEQFMMTSAMMVVLAFHDERVLNDGGKASYRTLAELIPLVRYTDTVVSSEQTLDPTSANFMRFTLPKAGTIPKCMGAEVRIDKEVSREPPLSALGALFGAYSRINLPGGECSSAQVAGDSLLPREAFEDWRMVTVRRPRAGEKTTPFYGLAEIARANELVVHTPRVGFFTTPAFFAVWPTNQDNSARVTLNQTLITGLAYSIDDTDFAIPAFDDSLDAEHAKPGTSCYGCHVTLDPMRQFFRREYSIRYSAQTDEAVRAQPAAFAVDDVKAEGSTVRDLGLLIGSHPRFASAWVQKLCFYATSAACPEEDPEFQRIVGLFREGGYDFRKLIIALLSSPLVTGQKCIAEGGGDLAGIARRRHFCMTLSARTGLPDACGVETLRGKGQQAYQRNNLTLAPTIPDDAFSRGGEDPLLISDVNLFVNGTYERICEEIAANIVGEGRLLDPGKPSEALRVLTERVMALPPSDPRHDTALQILTEHHDATLATHAAQVAMQSAFTLACLSPSLTGVGM